MNFNYINILQSNLILLNLIKIFINQYWLILIFNLIFSLYKFYKTPWYAYIPYILIFYKPLLVINIPLSNTLFFIHPNLLLLFIIISCLKLINTKTSKYTLHLTILLISLTLGGYWALQEISWGGWWNWDSIEMYICYIALFAIIFIHKYFKLLNYLFFNTSYLMLLLFNISIYFLLNRLGITISIHRFVKSNFLKYFTCWYILLFVVIFIYFCNKFKIYIFFGYVIYILLYTQFHSWYFLKKYTLYYVFFFLIKSSYFFKKKISYFLHKIYYCVIIFFFLFNFFNKSFFLKFSEYTCVINMYFFNKIFLINYDYFLLNHVCGFKKFFFYKVLNLKNFFFFNFFIKKSFLQLYFSLNFSKI